MMPTPWVSTLDIVDPFTGWTPAEFSDRFYTRYGEYPEFYAAGGFTSGIILMNAVDRMQSFDPAEIAAALKEMNVLTIYGNVSFNEDNMYGGSVLLVQVQSGALNTAMVLPYAAPNASLVYPMPTWTQKQCAFETSDCSGHGACNTEGVCVCDPPQYYGTSGSGSCETFCDGELDSDAETGASFCKEVRTFYVGGLSPLDRSDNEEISAVIKLAVELVNNNTDGFFDGDLQQVLFEIRVISIVCSEEAGYSGAEALDSWAEQKGSLLTGIVGPYCSTASVGVGGREQSYT